MFRKLAAYWIARIQFPGRKVASQLILFSYLTPMVLLVIPLSVVVGGLGLADTLMGLVVAYLTFAVLLCTSLLLGQFRDFPPDLEEAASLDGATPMRTLLCILLPVSAPGLATAALLAFTMAWGELFLHSPSRRHDSTGRSPAPPVPAMRNSTAPSWPRRLSPQSR
ncbi:MULTISPECIES: carbohydrate ABC transporter permease [unclassified Arthrobacter]|uniref:carbohydrate ABC transporter permease n=1 Tax=unclassified Arthrobacter TaxID=235627 RepID=UPI0027D86E95|nr:MULTISPECIES: carbohydrate ABC transporter permease [unclassified Arthrobacter]